MKRVHNSMSESSDDLLPQNLVRVEDVIANNGNHVTDGDESSSEEEPVEEGEQEPVECSFMAQFMDVAAPLRQLREMVTARLGEELPNHQMMLQDSQMLDAEKSLVEQGVNGSGIVQMNVEVKNHPTPRINILDVLKPTSTNDVAAVNADEEECGDPLMNATTIVPGAGSMTQWIPSAEFLELQRTKNIPADCKDWRRQHVAIWLDWCDIQFGLRGIDPSKWPETGEEICSLTKEAFSEICQGDNAELLWTHIELMKQCGAITELVQPSAEAEAATAKSDRAEACSERVSGAARWPRDGSPKVGYTPPVNRPYRITGLSHATDNYPGNRTGNNGQIQLWQFLLEILTDKDFRPYIQWVGDEGEFKLLQPEMVAHVWGKRKNKPTMNYEKLSRALRYYYDGDMIAKVPGKRFVYKFVCNLKNLMGYSASEMNKLVVDAERRKATLT